MVLPQFLAVAPKFLIKDFIDDAKIEKNPSDDEGTNYFLPTIENPTLHDNVGEQILIVRIAHDNKHEHEQAYHLRSRDDYQ